MSKLTAIRIRYENGTFSGEIPVGVFAENVNWTDTIALTDILGQVDFEEKGSIQDQIDKLLADKINYSEINNYIAEWINNNAIPIETDTTLTKMGVAADAEIVGDQLNQIKTDFNNITKETERLNNNYTSLRRDLQEIVAETYSRIDNTATYTLYIDCPEGTNIHGQNIHLNAKLFKNSTEVTNLFDDQYFTWTRQSSDYYGDLYWNGSHEQGTKTIIVTANDVRVNADFRCVFEYEGTTVTSD